MRVVVLLLMTTLAISVAAGGTVNKWVDRAGATHYSQSAPAGEDAGTVNIPPGPSKEATEEAIRKFQQQQFEIRQHEAAIEALARSKQEAAMADAVFRARRCSSPRFNLHVLEKQRPVYSLNENDEEVYLSDEERAAQIKIMTRIAEANCVVR